MATHYHLWTLEWLPDARKSGRWAFALVARMFTTSRAAHRYRPEIPATQRIVRQCDGTPEYCPRHKMA